MKEIRPPRHVSRARMKMGPLVGALAAAGLTSAILGGCAMMDGKDNYAGAASPEVKIQPLPLITRGEKSPDGFYALGKYYFYQGRLEQAKKAFWDAVRLNPGHVDALNGLGVVYDRLGQYDAARKVYEAALLKDPQAAHVWANLGYSLILAGKNGEAAAPLQKAVALDPSDALALQHLASINAVAAEKVAAAPPASEAQLAAAVPPQAAPTPPKAGPVASIVTAKGVAAVEAKPPKAPALAATPSSAAVAPAKSPREATGRQAEPAVQLSIVQAKETASQPQPVIAGAAKQTQYDGGSIKHEIVSSSSSFPGGTNQNISKPPVTGQQALPEAKLVPVASRAETGTSGMFGNLRIEVSNGNGVTGMARAVGKEMRQTGLNIARITNARPFNKPQTLIVCRPEMKSVAMELAQAMPVKPRIVLRDVAHRHVDVRVVLGADSALARKDEPKSPYLVASLGK